VSQLYASLIIIAGQSTQRWQPVVKRSHWRVATKSRPVCQIRPWCTYTDKPGTIEEEPALLQCTESGNDTKRPSCLLLGVKAQRGNFRRVCPPITKTDIGDSWTTLLTIH